MLFRDGLPFAALLVDELKSNKMTFEIGQLGLCTELTSKTAESGK